MALMRRTGYGSPTSSICRSICARRSGERSRLMKTPSILIGPPDFPSVLQDPQQVVVRVGEGRQLAPVGDRLGGVVDRRPVEELPVAGDDDLVGGGVPVLGV